MTTDHLSRAANVLLRAGAMGSRFVLMVFLARFVEPDVLGTLGLFFAYVALGMLLVGGEYYTYSVRALLGVPRSQWAFVFQHHALAIGILYLGLTPVFISLYGFGPLPHGLLPWFFLLLVLDHLVTELFRFLTAMQRPLVASWVLFLRMGAWVWFVLAIMAASPSARSIDVVLLGWFGGGLLALLLGSYVMAREVPGWRLHAVDLSWLSRGFKVGVLMLLSAILLKFLTSGDRIVFEQINGLGLLGVYVFFSAVVSAFIGVLDSAVFSFLYPRLVKAKKQGNAAAYLNIRREMLVSVLALGVLFFFVVLFLMPTILGWVGRPVYDDNQHVFWILAVGAVVYGLSMIPHYGLYARHRDRVMLLANAGAVLVFFLVVYASLPSYPVESVALGVLSAFAWLLAFKTAVYRWVLAGERY